ncbi:MAG TPA: methyltransferase domain-containing protein [Candidatus Angelobacter sp.]
MHRHIIPELLDTDAGTPREIQDSLADLKTINRYFGGLHTMTELISEVATKQQKTSLSWLDVAGATGDLAALTTDSLSKRGIQLQPVLLDRMPGHMSTPASGPIQGTPTSNGRYLSIAGDALALPFKVDSFDVVSSCLFVHHLEPAQVVQFTSEALRIARYAVLINDLIRHPLHVALAYAGYTLYRSRLTRHDSVASVRRAYTIAEIEDMLRQTCASTIEVRRFFPFRMGVIAWKQLTTT